jgi:anti-anti-sigma factor
MKTVMKAQQGGRRVVIRAGDLDICTAGEFLATLGQAAWAGAAMVVVDLSGTEFFDEAGADAIAVAAQTAAARGCQFGVVSPWWPVTRMLEEAGLTDTLDIAASASELLAACQGPSFPRTAPVRGEGR